MSGRFVILTHDHPVLHWDLMLDVGEALRTWRLEQPPQHDVSIAAAALPDHRRMYLDYEGPVRGDRGSVTRWDTGTYSTLRESAESVTAEIRGSRIAGTITLTRPPNSTQWSFRLSDK